MKRHLSLLAFLLLPASTIVAQTNNSGEVSTAGNRIARATQTNGIVEASSNVPKQTSENKTNEEETAAGIVFLSDCSGESEQKLKVNNLPKCQTDKSWLWSSLITLFGVILSAYLNHKWANCREHHHNRIVGKALVQAFKQEVSKGRNVIQNNMESIRNGSNDLLLMPTAMWDAYGSRLSEGVLSQIVRLDKHDGDKGFPMGEFPLHLARYYYYVCHNVDVHSKGKNLAKLNELLESANGVLEMLNTIEQRIYSSSSNGNEKHSSETK